MTHEYANAQDVNLDTQQRLEGLEAALEDPKIAAAIGESLGEFAAWMRTMKSAADLPHHVTSRHGDWVDFDALISIHSGWEIQWLYSNDLGDYPEYRGSGRSPSTIFCMAFDMMLFKARCSSIDDLCAMACGRGKIPLSYLAMLAEDAKTLLVFGAADLVEFVENHSFDNVSKAFK